MVAADPMEFRGILRHVTDAQAGTRTGGLVALRATRQPRTDAGGQRSGSEARRFRGGCRAGELSRGRHRQHRILRRAGAGTRDRRCGGRHRDFGGIAHFSGAAACEPAAASYGSGLFDRSRCADRGGKARLRAGGGSVVEMEAGGVAERARARDLPFYCVRVVTDLADEDLANDFNRALRPDGHFATMSILRGTLRNPLVRLPELLRLRNRCVRAALALGDFIADCRF